MAVAYYAELCANNGAPEIAAKARAHAIEMQQWPMKKIPDLPPERGQTSAIDNLVAAMHRDSQKDVLNRPQQPHEPKQDETGEYS